MGITTALIVAAGRGHRFGTELPKQYCMLAGETVLRRTLREFATHPEIDSLRVVIHPDDRELYNQSSAGFDILEPVLGGASRQDSVFLGLQSLSEIMPERVLIHDGARPFVDHALISRVIQSLTEDAPAALPALPVVDTLKKAKDGTVIDTIERTELWRAQTPQGFMFNDILGAHEAIAGKQLTDDVAVAEQAGILVKITEGSEMNIKITTQEDLELGNLRLLSARETRTGFGYDVHRFCAGDQVTLCGVSIPHDQALDGHSDADVALHALTDALLGTIGEGDIGTFFPPTDPQWKGVSSDLFLQHANDMVQSKGGKIINVDVLIICEMPKIGPHREMMKARISEILSIDPHRVNVKATTTERLGFTGRKEGIAAEAVASISL